MIIFEHVAARSRGSTLLRLGVRTALGRAVDAPALVARKRLRTKTLDVDAGLTVD